MGRGDITCIYVYHSTQLCLYTINNYLAHRLHQPWIEKYEKNSGRGAGEDGGSSDEETKECAGISLLEEGT